MPLANNDIPEVVNPNPFEGSENVSDTVQNGSKTVKHVGPADFTIAPAENHKFPWKIVFIICIALFLGGIATYFLTRNSSKVISPISEDSNGNANQGVERNVMSALTGLMYTEEESQSWNGQRPIGVMINNHIDARPQWGIGKADLVYEMVAEGGITRYLAFFNTELPDKLGPVRSTREYYLVLVKELGDAAIMHIGWSPQALTAIETWPVRSLARGGATFDRDQSRLDQGIATEHTAYVGGPYLRELTNELGWEGVGDFSVYKFKEDKPKTGTQNEEGCYPDLVGSCNPITIDFWYKGDYTAMFKYIHDTDTYLKYTGYDENNNPIPTIDANDGKQVEIKNLIIQFVPEVPIVGDDKNRLEYELVGSGEALVFNDGEVTNVIWNKPDRDSRTVFYKDGEEFIFNRGRFWISIVPDRNKEQVVY